EFTRVVPRFTTAAPDATVYDFTAKVTRGDGTSYEGEVVEYYGGFAVEVTDTYDTVQTDTLQVEVTDTRGDVATTVETTVQVDDAPLSAAALQFQAALDQPANVALAALTSGNPDARDTDFNVLVTWDDGTTSAGHLEADGGGRFRVLAEHEFATTGGH